MEENVWLPLLERRRRRSHDGSRTSLFDLDPLTAPLTAPRSEGSSQAAEQHVWTADAIVLSRVRDSNMRYARADPVAEEMQRGESSPWAAEAEVLADSDDDQSAMSGSEENNLFASRASNGADSHGSVQESVHHRIIPVEAGSSRSSLQQRSSLLASVRPVAFSECDNTHHAPVIRSLKDHTLAPNVSLRRKALAVISIANGTCERLEFGTSELLKIVHVNRPPLPPGPDERLSGTLKLRDLRQICSSGVGAQRPSIEPRRSCILVNMPYVKALILRNRIFLLARQGLGTSGDPDSQRTPPKLGGRLDRSQPRRTGSKAETPIFTAVDGRRLSLHDPELGVEGIASVSLVQKLIRVSGVQKAGPFEFLALESILFEVVSRMSDALAPMQELADRVQAQQTYVLSSTAKLHEIRDTKRLLQEIEGLAKGVAKSLEEILENEEDVRRLEISRFWERPKEWDEPADSPGAEDAEILLESYQQDVESLLHKIDGMDETLDTLLQIMQLHLATTRNNLLKFEIGLQVISVVVGVVAAVAGIFGMNIPNGYERDRAFFWNMARAMGWVIAVVSAGVFLFILRLKL